MTNIRYSVSALILLLIPAIYPYFEATSVDSGLWFSGKVHIALSLTLFLIGTFLYYSLSFKRHFWTDRLATLGLAKPGHGLNRPRKGTGPFEKKIIKSV